VVVVDFSFRMIEGDEGGFCIDESRLHEHCMDGQKFCRFDEGDLKSTKAWVVAWMALFLSFPHKS